jgi:hypothetical protein
MPSFITLGPSGSNHEFVLHRYIDAHGLGPRARIGLVDDFHVGARQVMSGEADFMLQCAAHPDLGDVTGLYRHALFVVDAFISQSRPMALMRRKDPVGVPDCVAVQAATRHYADLSRWPRVVIEPTVMAVSEGLLARRHAAGIGFASFAQSHPEDLEIVEPVGSICDAWVLFGRMAVDDGQAVICTTSPVSRLFAADTLASR